MDRCNTTEKVIRQSKSGTEKLYSSVASYLVVWAQGSILQCAIEARRQPAGVRIVNEQLVASAVGCYYPQSTSSRTIAYHLGGGVMEQLKRLRNR